ncbi:MAG: hypothetical protein KAH77_03320 [Thiomargarita sp.]|nr:hypothetical protein [Thiomargarita sp.]
MNTTQFINPFYRFVYANIAIVMIVFGLTLSITFLKEGCIFVGVGILIYPYPKTQRLSTKVIIMLLGLVISITSLYYNEKQGLLAGFLIQNIWLDSHNVQDMQQLQQYFEKSKKNSLQKTFADHREQQVLSLQDLYHNQSYQAVVTQGTPYISFDSTVRILVDKAQSQLKEQKFEQTVKRIPQMMKAGKYAESYQLLASLNSLKVHKQMFQAKKSLAKNLKTLQDLYQNGKYQQLITLAHPHVTFDCRITQLVNEAKKAILLQKIDRLIQKDQYTQAIRMSRYNDYADHYEYQKLRQDAQNKLKQLEKKKILKRISKLSSKQVAENLKAYTRLVQLFPEDITYQNKWNDYKKQYIILKNRYSMLLKQTEYGTQWPFIIPQGELQCQSPGIITFKVNDIIYAVDELAQALEYKDINEIWKQQDTVDLMTKADISHKGLILCTKISP